MLCISPQYACRLFSTFFPQRIRCKLIKLVVIYLLVCSIPAELRCWPVGENHFQERRFRPRTMIRLGIANCEAGVQPRFVSPWWCESDSVDSYKPGPLVDKVPTHLGLPQTRWYEQSQSVILSSHLPTSCYICLLNLQCGLSCARVFVIRRGDYRSEAASISYCITLLQYCG